MQVDEFGFHSSANWGICESHSWATVAAAVCEVRDQDGDLCRGVLEPAQSKPQLCLLGAAVLAMCANRAFPFLSLTAPLFLISML